MTYDPCIELTFFFPKIHSTLFVCDNFLQVDDAGMCELTQYLYLPHSCYGETFFLMVMVSSDLLQSHHFTTADFLCLVDLPVRALSDLTDDFICVNAVLAPCSRPGGTRSDFWSGKCWCFRQLSPCFLRRPDRCGL